MTHSYGKRSGTRYKFAKAFRDKGLPHLSTYLTTYHVGEMVTIKGNGAIQKGLPHGFYHGRTGRVYDITQNAVGVEIKKRVGNRQIMKRVHVRREHVFKSRCREEFEKRRAANDAAARENKGAKLNFKRVPKGPAEATYVKAPQIVDISPVPFTENF